MKGKKILAIIPARSGSKRVINKNSRLIAGKPLISWTIEAAKSSKYITDIFVSTDSKKIQEISELNGVNAFPLRPPELATDHATSSDVICNILLNIKKSFDYFIFLQPTSPLRSKEDIDGAIELFFSQNATCVVSVNEVAHPSWVAPIDIDGKFNAIMDSLKKSRSQDLRPHYCLNGAMYIMSTLEFIRGKSFFDTKDIYAFVMDTQRSVDIDTMDDWYVAESLLNSKLRQNK